MRHPRFMFVAVAAAVALVVAAPSQASRAAGPVDRGQIDAYTATVTPEQRSQLARLGHDLSEQGHAKDKVQLYLTPRQADDVRKLGINPQLTRVKGGQSVREFAAAQALNGFTVWRSYDEDGGIRDQMYAAAAANSSIAKLVKLGTTVQGRELLAIKLTQGAPGQADGSRPAVLYSSTQHAREWISTEVNRRLMNWYIDKWKANDPGVKALLQSTELWFVLVANPDGYQYTFDHERLWRKTLQDNNGDGQITVGDGVDPNRNWPNHWGYDNEGSSDITSSETYRGLAPASEPETRALKGLLDKVGFAFQVNWHSAGQWLLYAEGWQIATPTADDPIYYAMSGNLDKPAIEDFHPGLSSDVLYVTNGETTDYAHATTGALAWTPELSEGCTNCGFVFPDDEALVQEEFVRNLPFADSVARSALDPDDPVSVVGLDTEPFYVDSADPYKRGIPGSQLSFAYSYGDPQPVAVNAKRSLGAVTVKYRINGGAVKSAPTSEWAGGETYTPASVYYHQMRGQVTGTSPGDSVQVWFEGGGEVSTSFTYKAVSESGDRVLVVAAEDYTGASPVQKLNGPHYASYYSAALTANGIASDLYDIDASGRTAPDALGVLSHYDAVVMETGDDVITRRAGWGPGNADRLALDELLELRAYLNEGGTVMYAGNFAGQQYASSVTEQLYDPLGEIQCDTEPAPDVDPRRCLFLSGSGDGTNDVLQYSLGAYLVVSEDGLNAQGKAFDSVGIDTPFTGLTWGLNGGQSAKNQDITASFLSTSGILPLSDFPQFESWPSSRWVKPGGPFEPHTGTQYVYSQIADVTYKRLTREVAVPSGGGAALVLDVLRHGAGLGPRLRRGPHPGRRRLDHAARPQRSHDHGDRRQLPRGLAGPAPPPGALPDVVDNPAPADDTCTSTGTTGSWNAASGSSGGWEQWSVDLSAWQGQTVEISIAYVSDWAVQGVGVFVDDITYPDGDDAVVRDGPRRVGRRARSRRQCCQRQHVGAHRRERVQGRQLDHDPRHRDPRLRAGGGDHRRQARHAHGRRHGPPAQLTACPQRGRSTAQRPCSCPSSAVDVPRPARSLGYATWNSIRWTNVSSLIGPEWAARSRSASRSVSPEARTSSSVTAEKGSTSMESISMTTPAVG